MTCRCGLYFIMPLCCALKMTEITVHHFYFFGSLRLGYSAWSTQCHVWRSSKMSSILNSKPTKWKVRWLTGSGYICMLWHCSLTMSNKVTWITAARFGLSYVETVTLLWKPSCSCGRRGCEERANEVFSATHQQTGWMQKGMELLKCFDNTAIF